MRKRNIIAALVAGGLTLASTNLLAQEAGAPAQSTLGQDYKPDQKPSQDLAQPAQSSRDNKASEQFGAATAPSCRRASEIIGMEVQTDLGDRLGKVQDLIISLDSDRAPFAIVRYGGTLGIGGTRVAVPLKEFKLSDDQRMLTLAVNKDQFVSASTTPTGAWAGISDQEWAKSIDRFYSQPGATGLSRFERQDMDSDKQEHELVRTPADQIEGPVAKPAENQISTQVTKLIGQTLGYPSTQDIQVTVKKGVVTLKGKVTDSQLQRNLDDQIKMLPGVDRVDDQLIVSAKEN